MGGRTEAGRAGGWAGGIWLRAPFSGEAEGPAVGCITLSADSAFFSSRCRRDTYKELLNRPIKKKTEKKTDIPTSFPVRVYFFMWLLGEFDEPCSPWQLLATGPVRAL